MRWNCCEACDDCEAGELGAEVGLTILMGSEFVVVVVVSSLLLMDGATAVGGVATAVSIALKVYLCCPRAWEMR